MSVGLVLGVQAIILGAVLYVASPAVHRRWPSGDAAMAIVRTASLVGGIILVSIDLAGGQTPMSRTPNPVAGSVTSVEAGADLYQANCAACHGVDGHGGGPLAGTTAVTPPSLVAHLNGHTDGDLFYWISNGLPGGMPAWADRLTETQRWDLVNFLRALNGASPIPDGSPAATAATPGTSTADSPATAAAAVLPLVFAVGSLGWLIGGVRRRRPRRRR